MCGALVHCARRLLRVFELAVSLVMFVLSEDDCSCNPERFGLARPLRELGDLILNLGRPLPRESTVV
jgi:hypothetical protein